MEAVYIIGASTVFATLLGPVLAVQAQKFLEHKRSIKAQKMNIFSTLMATRAARASTSHLQALNMIDLAFNGGSNRQRRKTETDVLDSWRDYLDHLTSPLTEDNLARWNERNNEMFIVLLSVMASDLGLRYDRVLLRNGAYTPKWHADMESEQQQLRQLAVKVLSGEQELSMNVVGFPMDPKFAESQLDLQHTLIKAFSGEGALSVRFEALTVPKSTENVGEEDDVLLPKTAQLNSDASIKEI